MTVTAINGWMPRAEAADYQRIYLEECAREYPQVDAYEVMLGYALDRGRLQTAARTLACPVKANPPNWQHGRILYTTARARLANEPGPVLFVDVGTAKGFSALCLAWALGDSWTPGQVVTLDVVHPAARVSRNSIAELERGRLLTVQEFLDNWTDAGLITAIGVPGQQWLGMTRERIALAFVDGKHTYAAVSEELDLIKVRQAAGDVIVADDLQYPDIARAVGELRGYDWIHVAAHEARRYAIGTKQ